MTAQVGDHYYNYNYSPPVSPKSIPHGWKRKASTQDDSDELENNSLISNSFKKLRLRELPHANRERANVLSTTADTAKRPSASRLAPQGVSYRDATPSDASLSQHSAPSSRHHSYARHDTDDYMPVDETGDRVWVHDLNAEIAEIEAEEARQREEIGLSETGQEYAKIPEHLLRQNGNGSSSNPAADMQMILYRDPISISVPEKDDAVRKTIIEARQRMREKQAEERQSQLPAMPDIASTIHPEHYFTQHDIDDDDEDGMDLD